MIDYDKLKIAMDLLIETSQPVAALQIRDDLNKVTDVNHE